MTSARRKALPPFQPDGVDHPGLTFYRWLEKQEEGEKKAVPELLNALCASKANAPYQAAFGRWKKLIAERGWFTREYITTGALAIGLGNDSPLEVGLTLHHTYGMPVIPGSAVKGLVRRVAQQSDLSKEAMACLFGQQELAGGIAYFDAWYAPDTVDGKPFHRDVVTVHHPEYYKTKGKTPPTDFDDPTPVPFLIVRPGASFLFTLIAPDQAWAEYAFKLLAWGLENLGVGAKTNAGYGRMRVPQATVGGGLAASSVTETWARATIKRDPSRRDLTAHFEGRKAVLEGQQAEEIFATLSDDQQQKLKKGGLIADAEVEIVSPSYMKLVSVRVL